MRCNRRTYTSATRLPNPVMTRTSRKVDKSLYSQVLFELDYTFTLQHILLDIAKYILLILLLSFLSITPFRLWGSVGVINGLLMSVYLLI